MWDTWEGTSFANMTGALRLRAVIVAELGVADTDPFMLHIYAALAAKERRMISERIKAGLAAAKARGQEGSAV